MRPHFITAAALALALSALRSIFGGDAASASAMRPIAETPATAVTLAGGRAQRTVPIKDCTRFNGRSGFYGNIWCSEREQQLWDRYGNGRRPKK